MARNQTTRNAASLLSAALLAAASAAAHEIPAEVVVRMIVQPEGDRLRLAVRIPLSAVRDVEFPETSEGFLDPDALRPFLPDLAKLWVGDRVELFADGEPLVQPEVQATRISLPSNRSFNSFDQAVQHIRGPPLAEGGLLWEQVEFDMLLEAPTPTASARFEIDPRMEHLAERVVVALRFEGPDGERVFQVSGDAGRVPLDPSWAQAAWRFVQLGFAHILDGPDHLLFLLCLVIPFRRLRPLVWIVTAFTAAHSITLIAAASGATPQALWFPALVETLIAASVLYMALENILGGGRSHRRWTLAFGFGLVHGFGFSFALSETLQFAGSHLWTSLLAFNVGVELGQIAVLLVMLPTLGALFRWVEEQKGAVVVSALAAHTAWHWMTERGTELLQYDWTPGALTAADWASAARWAAAGTLLAGAAWVLGRRIPLERETLSRDSHSRRNTGDRSAVYHREGGGSAPAS